jgi:hypothetical protein
MNVHEIFVYVHGVTPRGQKSHHEQYNALHQAFTLEASKLNPAKTIPAEFCGVEWGWDPTNGQGKSHQLLDKAEEELGQRALAAASDPSDWTINPMRIAVDKFRGLMMFNFADMFYYASQDGKSALRYAMANSIIEHLQRQNVDLDQDAVSLTLIAHSAGSVIAFDFLFALFYHDRKVEEFIDPSLVKSGPSEKGPASPTATAAEVAKTLNDLVRLKNMAETGRLRIRRLFTFGSPVTVLAFRADSLLSILARDEDGSRNNRVDGAQYGLTTNGNFPDPPIGPRWVNFWDKDDPIAWPVEPLMKQAGVEVQDVYLDVSDSVTNAHESYWEDSAFRRELARRW